MNNKININPSSTKWLEKDDRVVADYFCDLGFRSLKQTLDMRVFDMMNVLYVGKRRMIKRRRFDEYAATAVVPVVCKKDGFAGIFRL